LAIGNFFFGIPEFQGPKPGSFKAVYQTGRGKGLTKILFGQGEELGPQGGRNQELGLNFGQGLGD